MGTEEFFGLSTYSLRLNQVVARLALIVQIAMFTVGLSFGSLRRPGLADDCWYFGLGNLLESANTATADGAVIIGQLPGRPYVVAIPGDNRATLARVKTCIPDAFMTRSEAGTYIQAGAFDNRQDAETVNQFLQALGYDARVIYLP